MSNKAKWSSREKARKEKTEGILGACKGWNGEKEGMEDEG